jgi:choline dehydrogenase-like flavoprotein
MASKSHTNNANLPTSDQNEDYMTIPGLAGGAIGTKYDWNSSYAPNGDLDDRVISIPQGRVVGGSTKLNRMVFDRGAQSDYDGWEALGNKGCNFDAILPYFKKVCSPQREQEQS